MRMLARVTAKWLYSLRQGLLLRVRKDVHTRDLLRTSGILYVGGLIALILVLIQQFSIANLLGSSNYGRLAIIVSSGLLVMLFLDFRTWELGIKLITTEITGKTHVEVIRLLNWLASIELITGLIGMVLLFVLAEPLAVHLLNIPGFEGLIRLYALSLPFRVLADGVMSTVPRLYNQFNWVAYKTISNNLFRLVLMIVLVKLGYGLSGAVMGAAISDVINFIVVVVIAWRILKHEMPHLHLFDRTPPKQQISGNQMMGDFWVFSSLVGLNQQAIIPFMGLLTSTSQVGLFRIGLDIAQFIDRLVAPITLGVTPQIMRIYEQEDWGIFRRYIKRTATLFLVAVIPLTLGILVLGPFVFPRVLHDEIYRFLPIVASITSIGYGINVAVVPWARPALIAIGHSRIQSVILVLQTLGLFVLAWLLVPRYGATGAAIAILISMASVSLFYLFFWMYIGKRKLRTQSVKITL
jgi:O-antigen/teichoic acid export membrane protein